MPLVYYLTIFTNINRYCFCFLVFFSAFFGAHIWAVLSIFHNRFSLSFSIECYYKFTQFIVTAAEWLAATGDQDASDSRERKFIPLLL
jgi:hypothetical protein